MFYLVLFISIFIPYSGASAGEEPKELQEKVSFVSGFIDLQQNIAHQTGKSQSAFALYDSALYLNGRSKQIGFGADIPFRTNSEARFEMPIDKAQLYVDYQLDTHWKSRVGQFDSPFGVELNDSFENSMSEHGLLFEAFAPYTHFGWMGSYLQDEFEIHGIVADIGHILPLPQEVLEPGLEWGLQATYSGLESLEVTPGLLMTTQGKEFHLLGELMLSHSIQIGKLDWGINFEKISHQSLVRSGAIVIQTFEVSKKSSLAIRLESLDPFQQASRHFQASGGFLHQLQEHFFFKLNYTWNLNELSHRVYLAGLFRF